MSSRYFYILTDLLLDFLGDGVRPKCWQLGGLYQWVLPKFLLWDIPWDFTYECKKGHCVCVCAELCPTFCGPMDCSPPGPSAHGIFQQEYWSRLPFPPPKDLPDPEMEPVSLASPALASGFFTTSATWEAPKEHQDLANLKLLVYLLFKASEWFRSVL